MIYRNLTEDEISTLQANSCWAEDWQRIEVSEDFEPRFFHRVMFYGDIRLGAFTNNVEVSRGFMKHSGVNNATLRNVTIGDNCLIENISGYINNYVIGDDCIISNVCTMETTDGATYGEGNLISVLNEVGDGNLILFHGLTSQIAALMVKHFHNRQLKDAIRRLIREEIERTSPEMATIGNRVKIVNTKEITNTVVYDDCEIAGAARLSDCTLMSNGDASVYIGTGVICENSIISNGSAITNSVKMQDCFVGEACKLSNGFTAAGSVFFANSYMANGEACAAFCGPFTASHHKSSLLIGGQFSFYNAGSATNFSNHAYKSIVNFDWLSPFTVGEILRGKKILEDLRDASGENVSTYNYHEYVIKNSSLRKGIKYYDIALRIYMGAVLKRHAPVEPATTVGIGQWTDISGLLLPVSEEQRLVDDILSGEIDTTEGIAERFEEINANYSEYRWAWSYRMIMDYYGFSELNEENVERVKRDYVTARRAWIAEIKKDAAKEYQLGDVEEEVFNNFNEQLDKEVDFENQKLYM